MKKPIDHERREAMAYQPKPPLTEEQRRALSEKMKAFNRKTGKVTAMSNRQVQRAKRPK